MPADPHNPSFEIAGTNPGEAQDWTVTITFTGYLIGNFNGGTGNPTPIEQFDQSPFVRLVSGGTPSIFDVGQSPAPGSVESFDYWSGNSHYVTAIGNGIAGEFAGAITLEQFDELAAGYVTLVTGGATFADTFGSDYVAGYATTVTGGTVGTFYQGGVTIDAMQLVQPDVVFSVPTPSNDTLTTATAHGLPNGRAVTLRTTGSPPGGLTTNTVYYVINTASLTVKLSLTLAGAAIDITSSGSGTHRLHADETLFWTDGP